MPRSYTVRELRPLQARLSVPTPAEDALADAIEDAFRDGVVTLEGLVERLNAAGATLDGPAWTDGSLVEALERLGR